MKHGYPSSNHRSLQVWIEPERHAALRRALKQLCLDHNTTLKDLVLEALDDLLRKYTTNESTTHAD